MNDFVLAVRGIVVAVLMALVVPASAEIWGIKTGEENTNSPSLLFRFAEDGSVLQPIGMIAMGEEKILADALAMGQDGTLYAFQLARTGTASRLVMLDKLTAQATAVGPFITNRNMRGACITQSGQLLALDATSNQLVTVSLASGQLVGTPVSFSTNGVPYKFDSVVDIAQRADGLLMFAHRHRFFELDPATGVLTSEVFLGARRDIIGTSFSQNFGAGLLFAFDQDGGDDMYIYDTLAGFSRTRLFASVFSELFNAGTGDLGALPVDYRPILFISSVPQGVNLCWHTMTNTFYQLEYKPGLTNGWAVLGAPIHGSGSRTCMVDSVTNHTQKFYRVRRLPGL